MNMMCDVYRDKGPDCTLGGITSKHDRLRVVTADEVVNLTPEQRLTALVIVESRYGSGPYLHAEPVEKGDAWVMAGGNFVYSCDSRFRQVSQYPISVHDRIES